MPSPAYRDRVGIEVVRPQRLSWNFCAIVTGLVAYALKRFHTLAWLAYSGPLVPRTAIAFRFFDPITAPQPHLEALWMNSVVILAYLTRFSPAGPMLRILNSCPVSCFSLSLKTTSVFCFQVPHRSEASRISILSSYTYR